MNLSVAAIIDWQGAAVRPLFESKAPDFVNVNVNFVYIKYVEIPADLQQSILPDNPDELSIDKQLKAHTEVAQVISHYRFLNSLPPATSPLCRIATSSDGISASCDQLFIALLVRPFTPSGKVLAITDPGIWRLYFSERRLSSLSGVIF
jgi:hypothetical protein